MLLDFDYGEDIQFRRLTSADDDKVLFKASFVCSDEASTFFKGVDVLGFIKANIEAITGLITITKS